MRKVILWMQQTVDGCVEGPNGEFDWPVVLPEMNRFFNAKAGELGAFLRPQGVPDDGGVLAHGRRRPGHAGEPGVVLLRHERVR